MSAPPVAVEQAALVRSIIVTAILGALGVIWGLASGSQMILLDGLYAIVGIVVSLLLLRAAVLAQAEPSHRYPYGRESMVPLVIGIQGVVLLAMLIYAATDAVLTIRNGGSDIAAGWAIAYGVITTVASVAFWRWLVLRSAGSDVLVAEATAWKVGSLRGVGMIIGFTLMAILAGTSFDDAVAYIDPAMVILTCVAFLPAPIKMVRGTALELLEAAPPEHVQVSVMAAVAAVAAQFELDEPDVSMTKVGPKLYVELETTVAPTVTVHQEHEVRTVLRTKLDQLPFDVWLNVELLPRTANP